MKKILLILIITIISIPFTYSYNLTNIDEKIIENITNKIEKKDVSYKNKVVIKINNLIKSDKYSSRINTILNQIIINISDELAIKEADTNNINLDIVRNNWLDWNNEVRKELGLEKYGYDITLESSADIWSEQANIKGEISHKRNEGDSFYDYANINSWLSDNGVVCENITGITHTENIWWGGYSCTDGECSDELSEAVQRAFKHYMDEKGTDNDAHYRSLTNKYFNNIGIGISIDDKNNNYYEYYLTIHYCTNLIK